MDQWMGNLFLSRGISPAELKKMQYWEMEYWNIWHEKKVKADEKALADAKKERNKK
jgi:hypothetical protein